MFDIPDCNPNLEYQSVPIWHTNLHHKSVPIREANLGCLCHASFPLPPAGIPPTPFSELGSRCSNLGCPPARTNACSHRVTLSFPQNGALCDANGQVCASLPSFRSVLFWLLNCVEKEQTPTAVQHTSSKGRVSCHSFE